VQLLVLQLLLMTKPAVVAPAPAPLPPRVKEFMQYLKSVAPDKTGQLKPRKPIDPDAFLRYVSAQGIAFSDLSSKAPDRVSSDGLRKVLKEGRGQNFRTIVHLAMTVSRLVGDPAPVEKRGDSWRVSVVDRYVLTFVEEASGLKLQAIEFIDPEGD
jgi:hypothetical protein